VETAQPRAHQIFAKCFLVHALAFGLMLVLHAFAALSFI
jgi:hypothetical protein